MPNRATRMVVFALAAIGVLLGRSPVTAAAASPPLAHITMQHGCNPSPSARSAYWVRFYVYNDRPESETARSASVLAATVNDANYAPGYGDATALARTHIAAGGAGLQTSSFGRYITAHLSVTLWWSDGKTLKISASAKPVPGCVPRPLPGLPLFTSPKTVSPKPQPSPSAVATTSPHNDVQPPVAQPSSTTVPTPPQESIPAWAKRVDGSTDWLGYGLIAVTIGAVSAVIWLCAASTWDWLVPFGRRRDEDEQPAEPVAEKRRPRPFRTEE